MGKEKSEWLIYLGKIQVIKVSAIVSTYNSETFFKGCIDDLLAQSIWQRGELEIVIVNAGSKQGEMYYVKEYLKQGIPLTVVTSLREPLYTSWNRAIRIAKGQYITNANTDDRHCPDAYRIQTEALDENPEIGLVYGDHYITPARNAIWNGEFELSTEAPYEAGLFNWPDFDPQLLAQFCYMGPAPMWRKDLHEEVGYFDESYMIAGDYEMWLRIVAAGIQMQRIDDVLGIFYWHPEQLGRQQARQSAMESRRAVLKYRQRIIQQWSH